MALFSYLEFCFLFHQVGCCGLLNVLAKIQGKNRFLIQKILVQFNTQKKNIGCVLTTSQIPREFFFSPKKEK